jgi:hypothetical protein
MKSVPLSICILGLSLGAVSPALAQPTFTEIHYWVVDTQYGTFGYREVENDLTKYRQREIFLGPAGYVYVSAMMITAACAAAVAALVGLAVIFGYSRRITK